MIVAQVSNVLIFANKSKDDADGEARNARKLLGELGVQSSIFSFEGVPVGLPDLANFDLIVSLGGDGTLLYISRIANELHIPILPVNLGTLGFIAANTRFSWFDTFKKWHAGTLNPSRRTMLEIKALRHGTILGRYTALNDGVVSSQGISKMIRLCLTVNNDCFGFYRADGLIIATPTGSTAYNLAAGGPALHPEMPAMVINPICPFTLASRPLVLPSSATVIVEISETRRSGAMLTVDGQETLNLQQGDEVRFQRAENDTILVVPPENGFFAALRSKLGWSGDSHA